MGQRKFHTLIKVDHKFGQNPYVRGRISGIMQVLCNGEPLKGFAQLEYPDGTHVFTTLCTEENYMVFKNFVELSYPGLCEFDYEIEE